MLGEEADLQVEVGPLVGRGGHAVLGDQHEGRQEDRLHRGPHGEDDEGRVPQRNTRHPAEIGDDPEAEEREVNVDEGHAAGEARHRRCQLVLEGGVFLLTLAPLAAGCGCCVRARRKVPAGGVVDGWGRRDAASGLNPSGTRPVPQTAKRPPDTRVRRPDDENSCGSAVLDGADDGGQDGAACAAADQARDDGADVEASGCLAAAASAGTAPPVMRSMIWPRTTPPMAPAIELPVPPRLTPFEILPAALPPMAPATS